MHEVSNVSELIALLSSSYPGAGVVGIDGSDGVGKTTLAKELGKSIGAPVVSLDDFVAKNLGGYVSNLRTDDLASFISSAGHPVIIEGVCFLAAIEVISVEAEILIYVKRVSEYNLWYDQDTCDPDEDEETLITRLSRMADSFAQLDAQLSGKSQAKEGESGLTPLREEIVRYHCTYRPSRKAQIVFLRKADA